MNDYKELIEMLRNMSKAIIREDAKLVDIPEENIWDADANAINDAADAIEQLVKERDDEREAADEWQHRYVELATKCSQLEKERDASVADLKSVLASECGLNQCRYCKYQEDDYQCHHDCIPYSEKWGWEWRGVQEDNDEVD